jgi:hypothetical protein
MKMVDRMRRYGIPFDSIRKVKKELQPADLVDTVLGSPKLRQVVEHLAMNDKRSAPNLEGILKDPEVREQLQGFIPNYLKVMILDALILRDHFALLVNHDGDLIPYKERYREAYLESQELKRFIQGTHLAISLTEILIEIFKSFEPDTLSAEMHLITHQEAEVLKALKLPKIKSVTVRFDQQGELDLMEITRERKIDRTSRIYEILLRDGYDVITIKTEKGNVVSCQNTTRKKFFKSGTGQTGPNGESSA